MIKDEKRQIWQSVLAARLEAEKEEAKGKRPRTEKV